MSTGAQADGFVRFQLLLLNLLLRISVLHFFLDISFIFGIFLFDNDELFRKQYRPPAIGALTDLAGAESLLEAEES